MALVLLTWLSRQGDDRADVAPVGLTDGPNSGAGVSVQTGIHIVKKGGTFIQVGSFEIHKVAVSLYQGGHGNL
jgi:hypothetical protein